MLFGRLRILGKLTLLVLVPLLGVAALTVPVVVNRIDVANRAEETVDAVNLAGQMGSVLQEMQEERLLSLGYLLGLVQRPELAVQTAKVTSKLSSFATDSGVEVPEALARAAARAQGLDRLRAAILARSARPDQVIDEFAAVITPIIDALDLIRHADLATSAGRQVVALDSVLRNDEAISQAACLLAATVGFRQPLFTTRAFQRLTIIEAELARLNTYATPEQAQLYTVTQNAFTRRVGADFFLVFAVDPARAVATLSLPTLFPSLRSVIVLGRFLQKKITADVNAAVTDERRRATTTAYSVAAGSVLLLLVVLGLSLLMTRAVARPLRRLTGSADRIARAAEEELRRVADDESETVRPLRLDPVDVQARDEIGDLARAFDRVQGTAVRLVERQVVSRRNVAQMFGHVGRRTQNLVGRQLALIDRLEREESDSGRLRELYRLDHMSSRLRRSASSLVVLSGAGGTDDYMAPMPLADVVRLALGEIEDYTRVDVEVPADIVVMPAVVGDLTLLLAELMENATVFSPPHTRVTVAAGAGPDGARLAVVDHGIGLPDERLAEENARLTHRERLDLVPTEVLGLFVVGRLARRHGLFVGLSATPGGGLTAMVDLHPQHLLAARPDPVVAGTAQPAVPVGPGPRAALPSAPGDAGPLSDGTPRLPAQPFDSAALTRASRTLEMAGSWNAFVPHRSSSDLSWHQPQPQPEASWPPASAEPGHQPEPPAEPVVEPIVEPVASADALPRQRRSAERSELRRRVPGAHLPESNGVRVLAAPSSPADADAARDLVEAFESGVSRAHRDAAAAPPPPSFAPAAPAAPAPRMTPDRNGLTRRVPGATLPATAPPMPPAASRPEQRLDPDEARSLIEQFESGVALALREARPHQEGQPR